MTFLALRALTKKYDGAEDPCVKGINMEVEEGQIVVLLGPSGCGKTTTMKMIAGLIEPTSGDVQIDGRSIIPIPTEKRDVSMVFQKPLLFPHMTVAQNIGFGLKMRGTPKKEIEQKVEEMLDLVKLKGYGGRKASQLSGGQEQRVSLARALIIGPKLLLLDEPLSALDAELRLEMRDLILKIKERYKVTIMFVTHDQQEAMVLADKIALMVDGEIVQYDVPPAFYTRPRTRRVAEFFGWTNFIPAIQKGRTVICSFGEFIFPGLEEHDGPICLTVRPEAAVLCPRGEGYRAVVRSSTYMGTRIDYEVDCLDARLGISLDSNRTFEKGEELFFRFVQSKIWAVKCDGRKVCDNRVVWENTAPFKSATPQDIGGESKEISELARPVRLLSEQPKG
jgi:ABC-type Fe3+/spermidine/putrescine transport system ATPase subunit